MGGADSEAEGEGGVGEAVALEALVGGTKYWFNWTHSVHLLLVSSFAKFNRTHTNWTRMFLFTQMSSKFTFPLALIVYAGTCGMCHMHKQ